MKKKEELKWRLGKLPTPSEVSELVKDKIITNEEARDILFSKETKEEKDVEELKSEIKFLKQTIEKLSTPEKIIKVIEQVQPIYIKNDWYKPYHKWYELTCGSNIALYSGTSNCAGTNNSMSLCSFSSIN